ncbi:hypothetical protein F7725_012285 [Dissostichus mawsoni]|uniref:Uncharacterized protein n=1 Tax=Dissostichus mawsoni TaxID=36200 RepID=A0A7J5YN22_DISMA|nr:hypothetical protein F7725_012285 [Dissostichus mawsoni]
MDHGDRGMGVSHLRYEDEEDHQSIYIGVPVPPGYRRKRRRRRSSREAADMDRDRPAERLRYILNEDDDLPKPTLFTEMDTLQREGDDFEWKESASLFELRTCLQTGTVLLDLEGYSLPQIIDEILESQIEDGMISPDLRDRITYVLLRKHRHQTKKPIHRSIADIGKSSSSTSGPGAGLGPVTNNNRSTEDLRMKQQSANYGRLRHAQSRKASNVLVGEVDFLNKPFVAFVRLAQATTLGVSPRSPFPPATLMVDDLFSDVAYKARDREDLIAGIDEFLDEVIVLPPGEWDPKIRIEPPKKVPTADKSFCGGLYLDIKRKLPWLPSDIYEGFHYQSISAGVMESFSRHGVGRHRLRLWIGMHSCLQCFILVATDASFIIKYMTRFTEEGFSSLISFIFISDAIKKMVGSFKYYPINTDFKPEYLNVTGLDWSQLSKKECLKYGGALVGKTCKYVPDLALMSFILFFGTYSMTLRKLISDFSIFMSIMTFPTRPGRGWLVMPFGKNPWWVYVASFVPALLVTILIFMDQQISAMESASSAPGEQPQFLGVSSLSPGAAQFWDRIKLYMMPSKHQPDFPFLRHVPLRKVHLFTLVQILCLAVLWTLKSTFLAIIFPVMISCPSSPAVPIGRGMGCPVPQVKIEMESDYDSDIDPRRPRDMSSETTL